MHLHTPPSQKLRVIVLNFKLFHKTPIFSSIWHFITLKIIPSHISHSKFSLKPNKTVVNHEYKFSWVSVSEKKQSIRNEFALPMNDLQITHGHAKHLLLFSSSSSFFQKNMKKSTCFFANLNMICSRLRCSQDHEN